MGVYMWFSSFLNYIKAGQRLPKTLWLLTVLILLAVVVVSGCTSSSRRHSSKFGTLGVKYPDARTASTSSEAFPLYPAIEANVAFWEDIYSRYTTRQAVLHDSRDLSKVYAVVELEDRNAPGGHQRNEERTSRAKARLADLLSYLAEGGEPRTKQERHVAELFDGEPASSLIQARENLRVQIGQKDRFLEGVRRSGKYMPYIREVLARENLPQELAYLPHVESSFNPKAGSKVGAYGLWQFTKGTAKDYMVVNSLVDERFDPYIASRAAARFLKGNYQALGSWPLALTAYNYGRAGMVRAKNEYGSYEQIFKYYSGGYFKFAARNFYSEFLAAMRVAKQLEQSGFAQDRPDDLRSYRLGSETSVATLCARHNLDRKTFLRLNPALQAPVVSGKRKVPANYLVRTLAQ